MKGELPQSGVLGRKMVVVVKGWGGGEGEASDSFGQLQVTRQPGVRRWEMGWKMGRDGRHRGVLTNSQGGGSPLGIRQDRAQRGAVELSKASWVPFLI